MSLVRDPAAVRPPLGVAVLGAGDMGTRHAAHWRTLGERVSVVYDPDASRATAAAAAVGAAVAADSAAALERGDVDVVSVCTPTHLHAPLTVAALNAGKHVLCEKPAALTLAGAHAMKDAERSSGRLLRIGFMRRFDPSSERLRADVRRIGEPVLAQATVAAGIRPKHLMHDAAVNGGPIIDMCCHIFDQWSLLYGGQAVRVRAHGYTFSEGKPELSSIEAKALDSAHITLEYPPLDTGAGSPSGGVGQIHVSWGLPAGIPPVEEHTYMGPDGLVGVVWPTRVTLRNGGGSQVWEPIPFDPWLEELRNFRDEVLGRPHRPLATIDDGIAALRTSLAVLESVREGRDVEPDGLRGDAARGAA